jgi:hypothetical protein
MNALDKFSWRTMFIILFALIALSALGHVLNHTPMTNVGFISWK